VLEAGDQLRIEAALQTIPGLVYCFRPQILHKDGTTTDLEGTTPGLTTSLGDSAIAVSAPLSDCPKTLGVIGVASGATAITVKLDTSGRSLSSTVPVQVLPYTIELSATALRAIAPLGTDAPMPDFQMHTFDSSHTEIEPPAVLLPTSTLSLHVADTNVATSTIATSYSRSVPAFHGVARGQTTYTLTYGPPANRRTTSPLGLEVPANGTFTSLSGLDVTDTNGDPTPARVVHGTCVEVHLQGTFQDATFGAYTMDLTSGVSWTVAGGVAHLVAGVPEQLCADQMGEATVEACYSGKCRSTTLPTYADSDIVGLTANVIAKDVTLSCPNGDPSVAWCPAVRYTLKLAGGATRDVTTDPLLGQTGITGGGTTIPFFPMTKADGTLATDASGDPCYSDYLLPASLVAGDYPTTVSANFANYMNARATSSLTLRVHCP
jgi:hypothetical protein